MHSWLWSSIPSYSRPQTQSPSVYKHARLNKINSPLQHSLCACLKPRKLSFSLVLAEFVSGTTAIFPPRTFRSNLRHIVAFVLFFYFQRSLTPSFHHRLPYGGSFPCLLAVLAKFSFTYRCRIVFVICACLHPGKRNHCGTVLSSLFRTLGEFQTAWGADIFPLRHKTKQHDSSSKAPAVTIKGAVILCFFDCHYLFFTQSFMVNEILDGDAIYICNTRKPM